MKTRIPESYQAHLRRVSVEKGFYPSNSSSARYRKYSQRSKHSDQEGHKVQEEEVQHKGKTTAADWDPETSYELPITFDDVEWDSYPNSAPAVLPSVAHGHVPTGMRAVASRQEADC